MKIMEKRIIYTNENGSVVVLIPIEKSKCGYTVEQIAAKDVPAGRPYKIVDVADIPSDRSARNAWFVDDADLIDGTGADYGAGSDWAIARLNFDDTAVLQNTNTGQFKLVELPQEAGE